METVVVSRTFQVMIPPAIRKRVALAPGQQVRLIPYDNRIELIPVKPLTSMRGFLKGIDTSVEREDDRV